MTKEPLILTATRRQIRDLRRICGRTRIHKVLRWAGTHQGAALPTDRPLVCRRVPVSLQARLGTRAAAPFYGARSESATAVTT